MNLPTMTTPLGYDVSPHRVIDTPKGREFSHYYYRQGCGVQTDGGLSEVMKELWECGLSQKKYSDLVVKCGELDFHVHKIVVCSQSEFFENACKPGSPWVEA